MRSRCVGWSSEVIHALGHHVVEATTGTKRWPG
jgi:hypothetical protein